MATSPTIISPDDVQQDSPPPTSVISPDDVQPDAPSQQAQPAQQVPTQQPPSPPQQQVAAGQGAITPQQVPAGQGAIGPGSVMGGVGQYLRQQAWGPSEQPPEDVKQKVQAIQDISIPGAARDYWNLAGEHLKKGEYLQAAGTVMSMLGGAPTEQRDPFMKLITTLIGAHSDREKAQPTEKPEEKTTSPSTPPTQSQPSTAQTQGYTTKLSDSDEQQFQNWAKQNKIPWQDSPKADYDMRGFWKAMSSGDPEAQRNAQTGHFPDTWKTPYHESFSNESKYATKDAPSWRGNQLVNKQGKVVFDENVEPLIKQAAEKYGLEPKLIRAVITQESNFNPKAVGSSKEKGLMQLMDDTARNMGVKDSFNPAQNIEGGTKYLKSLLDQYGGDLNLALAAYNHGPGGISKGKPIPNPDYVSSVLGFYGGRQ